MDPLVFRPILKRIRWGGRRLGTLLGKPLGDANDYAESWEIADHGEDQSVVVGGPFAGWTLNRLVVEKGEELLGAGIRDAQVRGREQFPLLVKFLDANDRLSVQVHPDDKQAARFDPASSGKTEAWVIIHAEPGSRLYAGLNAGVGRETLRSALAAAEEAGWAPPAAGAAQSVGGAHPAGSRPPVSASPPLSIEDCLHAFEVSAGECVFIPAGTVHAIGEGIVLAEIQQSSDLTFRLFDWGRLDSEGRKRPLHVEEAIGCIDFNRGPVEPVVPRKLSGPAQQSEELVRCEYFAIRRHTAGEPFTLGGDDRMRIVMTLAGCARARSGEWTMGMPTGQTLLLPAAADGLHVSPEVSVTLLESFL